ncbi:unnamed protein product [Closterium sp. NIES-54]
MSASITPSYRLQACGSASVALLFSTSLSTSLLSHSTSPLTRSTSYCNRSLSPTTAPPPRHSYHPTPYHRTPTTPSMP